MTISSLVTEPGNSIIHQSFHSHEREEPLNGDGFGIAWYVPEMSAEPAVFKDVTPAWNNINLINLARVTLSPCILAHVRAATPGLPVVQYNCHPFSYGPFTFMHNGRIGGFQEIRRAMTRRLSDEAFFAISGSTDSEHLFALFMDRYRRAGKGGGVAMAEALEGAIAEVEGLKKEAGVIAPSFLNIAVTDGNSAVVSRYISTEPERANSLYTHTCAGFRCSGGRYQIIGPGCSAVIVASEPLTEDAGWKEVPPNTMLVVNEDLTVEERALAG